jgi:hypothetical protein
MNTLGAVPRPATIGEMANILLAIHSTQPPPTIGKNWPLKFVERREELQTRFSVRYDYQSVLNKDPKALRPWFVTVQSLVDEHGIQAEDIYNFDKTEFTIGLVSL